MEIHKKSFVRQDLLLVRRMCRYVPVFTVLIILTSTIHGLPNSIGLDPFLPAKTKLNLFRCLSFTNEPRKSVLPGCQRLFLHLHRSLYWRILMILGSSVKSSNINLTSLNYPFIISGCGEFTMNLGLALDQTFSSVLPALQDVDRGNNSPLFKALFKADSTKSFVRGVLHRIASHYPLYDLAPFPQIATTPNFACVTEYTRGIFSFTAIDIMAQCELSQGGAAFWVAGVSYIFLCPAFWRVPVQPTFSDCPSVRKNQWAGPGISLANYQTYLLVHEMVHFYLGLSSLGAHTVPKEVYPINDCVGLNSYNSLHNPQNYQYYVARRVFKFPNKCHRILSNVY